MDTAQKEEPKDNFDNAPEAERKPRKTKFPPIARACRWNTFECVEIQSDLSAVDLNKFVTASAQCLVVEQLNHRGSSNAINIIILIIQISEMNPNKENLSKINRFDDLL